jgi:hypothetical protein
MEAIGNCPFYIFPLQDGGIISPLEGEVDVHSLRNPGIIQIKVSHSSDYCDVNSLHITSHRLYYFKDGNIFAVNLNTVQDIQQRGGFLRSRKIVISLCLNEQSCEISVRIKHVHQFHEVLHRLREVWTRKAWVIYRGNTPMNQIGGISRVLQRVDHTAVTKQSIIDSGFSDFSSLRGNAKGLSEVLERIKRDGTTEELNEIDALLSHYGLVPSGNSSVPCNMVLSDIVESAVKAAEGVIMIHDLYCLVNRKLRLEKLYTPREFLLEIQSIKSVECISILGYRAIINLSLLNLNRRVVILVTQIPYLSTKQVGENVNIGNAVVLKLLLLKIEEEFGEIVRDEDDLGQINWYRNIFYPSIQRFHPDIHVVI